MTRTVLEMASIAGFALTSLLLALSTAHAGQVWCTRTYVCGNNGHCKTYRYPCGLSGIAAYTGNAKVTTVSRGAAFTSQLSSLQRLRSK